VVLSGYGTFEVTDVMNKRFTNSVDIWCGDLEAARLHGRQEAVMIWQ
jgi:3D (Asp-Asp-Asp) domain-containing protein